MAVDGCKFKADNNCRRYHGQEQLAKLIEAVEARIEEYLGQWDEQDAQTQGLTNILVMDRQRPVPA